jgi:hypothetical protein
MEDLLITKDGRYIVGFDKIIDTHTNFCTESNNPNPIFVCEMFKNQSLLTYRHSLLETKDLFSKMRKLMYGYMDQNMIFEHEMKFGHNLINESTSSYSTEKLISESWDHLKNKLIKKYNLVVEDEQGFLSSMWNGAKNVAGAVWNGAKNVASAVVDKVKEAGAWVVSKGIPWFMESLEKFMMSPVGIGLDIALTAIGVGKLATGILWGILLCWKIYKYFSGKSDRSSVWTYIDIAVCLAGLVFSGAAKGLKAAFTSVGGKIAKVGGKVLQPIMSVLGKGAQGIINLLAKPFEWLAKIFGSKVEALVGSVKNGISDIIKKLLEIFTPAAKELSVAGAQGSKTFGQVVKSGIKKDFITPLKNVTGASARKAAVKGLAWGGGTHLAMKGVEKFQQHNSAITNAKVQQDLSNALATSLDKQTEDILNGYK